MKSVMQTASARRCGLKMKTNATRMRIVLYKASRTVGGGKVGGTRMCSGLRLCVRMRGCAGVWYISRLHHDAHLWERVGEGERRRNSVQGWGGRETSRRTRTAPCQ